MTQVYVGAYTRPGGSKGIYRYTYDESFGTLHDGVLAAATPSPSFLAISPDHRFLYAVNEVTEFEGETSGSVTAFAVNADGSLRELNQRPSHGRCPCYVAVHDGQVFVTNYVDATVAAYPVADDGSLEPATSVVEQTGSGPNEKRQEAAHAHSITIGPDGRYAFVCDLGADAIVCYELNGLRERSRTPATPGAGPRHMAFAAYGTQAFVINELDSTIVRYACDDGKLTALDTVRLLPGDFDGDSIAADIHVTPDGKYVLGTNRGHESIAVCRIREDGLELVDRVHVGGEHPRNFMISPDGRFVLVTNQNTNNIVTFAFEDGHLKKTGTETKVAMPVCLLPV